MVAYDDVNFRWEGNRCRAPRLSEIRGAVNSIAMFDERGAVGLDDEIIGSDNSGAGAGYAPALAMVVRSKQRRVVIREDRAVGHDRRDTDYVGIGYWSRLLP